MKAKRKTTKPKAIIGKGQGKKLQSAVRNKFINLFVSRLKPSTTETDVQEIVADAFANNDGAHIDASHVNCSK